MSSTIAMNGDALELPIRLKRGNEAIAQRLENRFRFFLREWFLDRRKGLPYFEQVLVVAPDTGLINSLFRDVILSCPGIRHVEPFRVELNRRTRQAIVGPFEARSTEDGEPLRIQSQEFIMAFPS